MTVIFWLIVIALAATIGWGIWYVRRQSAERERAEAERAAAFLSNLAATPRPAEPAPAAAAQKAAPTAAPAAVVSDIALQKLLFEAAHKAGEANEPALAIQLYARLLVRYPATSFAEPARVAAAALKKKLVKG